MPPCPKSVCSRVALSYQNTGDPEAVKLVKQRFGLEEHGAESKWGPTV